jgi:unsaturated chondroitin disaccharide hydrolase
MCHGREAGQTAVHGLRVLESAARQWLLRGSRRVRFARTAVLAVALAVAMGVFPASSAHAGSQLSRTQMLAAQKRAAAITASADRSVPPRRFTYLAAGTVWGICDAKGWVSGYLPGQLWLGYQLNGDSWFRKHAITRQSAIASLNATAGAIDIGQRYYYSLAKAYELTGDRRYRNVALKGAAQQARRFNYAVGAFRSRNTTQTHQVIIDDLMNIQLLFWAARNGGGASWGRLAHRHALTVARDFVRDDGSTYHKVLYSPTTGAIIQTDTEQGYSPQSMWSRGQAWGIYGFANAYAETKDPVFLQTARRVADRYISDLPSDSVPYWDFRDPDIPEAPRDSSAAAIAASGLIGLARVETDTVRADGYVSQARQMLSSLNASYLSTAGPMVLRHGTLNWYAPRTHDVALSFGDYFYFEALLRLRLLPSTSNPLQVKRVSASAGSPGRATDRSPSSAWSAKGKQWIQLDLGRKVPISAVRIAIGKKTPGSAGFKVLVSSDKKRWSTALKMRSTVGVSSIEHYDFSTKRARYVRVLCNGTSRGSRLHMSAIRVY